MPYTATTEVRRAFLIALYEYLIVTAPVALYVALEAHVHSSSAHFFSSPEWAIATVFLTFQGLSLYLQDLRRAGGQLAATWLGICALGAMLFVILAALNAHQGLQMQLLAGAEHSAGRSDFLGSTLLRLALLGLSTIGFFLFVASGALVHLRHRRSHGTPTK